MCTMNNDMIALSWYIYVPLCTVMVHICTIMNHIYIQIVLVLPIVRISIFVISFYLIPNDINIFLYYF